MKETLTGQKGDVELVITAGAGDIDTLAGDRSGRLLERQA